MTALLNSVDLGQHAVSTHGCLRGFLMGPNDKRGRKHMAEHVNRLSYQTT